MKYQKINFCERLKDLRIEQNATQKDVAKGCGLTPTCICQLETGVRNPTGSTVAMLAKYFDVSADYLLGLSSDESPKLFVPMGDSTTAKERELLEAFRQLLPETQDFILRSAQSLRDKKSVT